MRKVLFGTVALVALAMIGPVRSAETIQSHAKEKHLRNIRQLTFGGENAEAYFSLDGKKIIFQSTRAPYKCDQQFTMNTDGSAGKGVNLATSMDIYQPDGMRLSSSGKILMVAGRGKDGNGRLDEVTVSGDSANITVVKGGYMLPTAVTVVGGTAYVLEAKLNYQRDPALKDNAPGTFKAYAVPVK